MFIQKLGVCQDILQCQHLDVFEFGKSDSVKSVITCDKHSKIFPVLLENLRELYPNDYLTNSQIKEISYSEFLFRFATPNTDQEEQPLVDSVVCKKIRTQLRQHCQSFSERIRSGFCVQYRYEQDGFEGSISVSIHFDNICGFVWEHKVVGISFFEEQKIENEFSTTERRMRKTRRVTPDRRMSKNKWDGVERRIMKRRNIPDRRITCIDIQT